MLQEGRAEPSRARRRRSGCSRRTAARETAARPTGSRSCRGGASTYRGTTLEEMDLPAILRRAPELCLIDELAHTNAPGLEHAQALRGHRATCSTPASTCSPRSTSSTSSRSTTRSPSSAACACARRCPTACSARRRDRARRRHARGAARAPARGQGLPGRAHRRRAQRLLPDREPRRAARDRAAPGRRGGRGQAARVDDGRRHARRPDGRERRAQAVGERLLALVEPYPGAQRLVRRAWRSAQRLGADLDVLWVAPGRARPDAEEQRALARAAPAGLGARRARCS